MFQNLAKVLEQFQMEILFLSSKIIIEEHYE